MKLGMDQKCNFGKTGGVEQLLLLTAIPNYLGFAETRRQVWLILLSTPMEPFIGIYIFLGMCMIRNWKFYQASWIPFMALL